MSGNGGPLARTEDRAHEIGVLDRDIEQGSLAGVGEMSDGRLVQVPGVVELVAAVQVHPSHRSRAGRRLLRIDGPRWIEIAVGFLSCGDQRDQVVELLVEGGVGMAAERI